METTLKTCFKCLEEKPRAEFYSHKEMADGLLGKCKACTKRDVSQHRAENIDELRAYDRLRGSLPHRKEYNRERSKIYAETGAKSSANKRYAERNPDKRTAVGAVRNAVRNGKIMKYPCLVCGDANSQGHHFDYSRPLDVIWLCAHHHSAFHKVEREIDRRATKRV